MVRNLQQAALVVLLLLLPLVASAQDAKTLKTEGDAAMDRLDFQVALEKYTRAYDLSHDPALLYNRARSLQSLNRMPEAVDELERFEREAPADLKARVPQLKQLLTEFRGRVGTVTVKGNVAGARVILDNKDIGTTPLEKRVNAGKVKIEIVAEGYEPYSETVDIGPSGVVIEPRLVGKSTVLVVRADPNATSSLVDGAAGTGTPFEKAVTPGKHVIVLKRDGFFDVTSETNVGAGERKTLNLKLESKPITLKWWFWTTVALVTAAVVIPIVVAATTERPADIGDIPPGKVSAP